MRAEAEDAGGGGGQQRGAAPCAVGVRLIERRDGIGLVSCISRCQVSVDGCERGNRRGTAVEVMPRGGAHRCHDKKRS